MKITKILILLSFFALPLAGRAADIYTARVEVADESPEARAKGLSAAFEQVLVQQSGDADIAKREGVSQLIGKAADYVQQFRYVLEPSAAGGNESPLRMLEAGFDKHAVDQALGQTGGDAQVLDEQQGAAGQAILVEVHGVVDASTYARILRLLDGQENAGELSLLSAKGDELIFQLMSSVSPDELAARLTSSGQVMLLSTDSLARHLSLQAN